MFLCGVQKEFKRAHAMLKKKVQKSQYRAYTLIELVITMMVLGVIISMALPRYFRTLEVSRSGEGRQTLAALVAAQKLYLFEHRVYSDNREFLRLDLPNFQFFDPPTLSDPDPFNGSAEEVAQIKRTGSYILMIDEDANLTCDESDGPSGICDVLGIPE